MALAPEDQPKDQSADETAASAPETEQPATPAEEAKNPVPEMKKNWESKVTLATAITKEEQEDFDGPTIAVLPDSLSRIEDDMDASGIEELDIADNTLSWYNNLLQGFKSVPSHGIFEDALADPNAHWTNALAFNGQNINIGRPKFHQQGRSGISMNSDRLLLSVRSRLGLGSPVQTPMMSSGFYITTKPIGEDEIIAMWREIIADPVKLGRNTHGLMFSNNQVFVARSIMGAYLRAMVDTTVQEITRENILDHLTVNDLPIIAWSMACALYPNGFPMTRSVFTEDTKMPKEEIHQIIDVRKSLQINDTMFKPEQLAHLIKRGERSTTLKQVKEYRDSFIFTQNNIVDLGEGVKLHLHTPSLREYFDSGEKWINEINAAVFAALGENASENHRIEHIARLAKASRLRQYSHYVKQIEEDGQLFSTRENVDKTLTGLSSKDSISKKMMRAVSDYINNTQVALVATTSVNEYEDKVSGQKWPRLIPLDPVSVFFQSVEQKLLGITSRVLEDTSA